MEYKIENPGKIMVSKNEDERFPSLNREKQLKLAYEFTIKLKEV